MVNDHTKDCGRLEQWICLHGCLWACVYGHPEFRDGKEIRTSTITCDPSELAPGMIVHTKSGSSYLLGEEFKCGVTG